LGVGFSLLSDRGECCRFDVGEGIHREDPFRGDLYTMCALRSKAKIKPFIFTRYFNLMLEIGGTGTGWCIVEFMGVYQ